MIKSHLVLQLSPQVATPLKISPQMRKWFLKFRNMRFFAELVLRFGGLKLKRRIFSQIGETFHNGKEAFCISFSLFIFDHLTETIPMLFQQFNAFKKIALWQVYHSTFIRKKLDLTQYYSILTLFYNFNSKSDILIFAFEYSDKRNLRITFFITPKLDH